MKWKNSEAVCGSDAIVCDLISLFGPEFDVKLSKSMSVPAKTWAMGSFVSEGLIVIHKDGGPHITIVDHI